LLAPLAFADLGCATLMSGVQQKIEVSSSPEGAQVVCDGGQRTVTPGVILVQKRAHHRLTFSKPGYLPVSVELPRRVQWLVLGDVFFLILPGLVIDFLGGGAFALPEQMKVRLTPAPAGYLEAAQEEPSHPPALPLKAGTG